MSNCESGWKGIITIAGHCRTKIFREHTSVFTRLSTIFGIWVQISHLTIRKLLSR